MQHQDYQLEDFLQDPTFRHWVHGTDAAAVASWNDWLAQHPHQRELADQAADVIRGIQFDKPPADLSRTREDWERLQARLPPTGSNARTITWYGYRVAATVALLLAALLSGWYFYANSRITYATAYGQKRTVVLPDGSAVTLNADSRLRVPRRWGSTGNRQVWLEGEAHFAVTHRQQANAPVKFTVHTADVDVEVLGTEFNVKHRSERQTTITLESGRIRVHPHDERLRDVTLRPGEQLEFSGAQPEPRRVDDPRRYSTWMQGQLVLDGKTLAEVAKVIEETYGRKVIFKEASLAALKLNGTYPLDNMQSLFRALSVAAQVEVTYNDRQVVFETKKP